MILHWDIYDITTHTTPIHGVKLRGRIRKLCIEHNQSVLVENATDAQNTVRFAILNKQDPNLITTYLHTIIPDVTVTQILSHIPNPVLSKLKVNDQSRYETS